jgi:Helix-turn-helix domain
MSLIFEERASDSPYIENVTRGWTLRDGSSVRPAECHWHMVFVRVAGRTMPIVVGPLTTAGVARWGTDAEILWIRFKLGTFIPHLPAKNLLDQETMLPEAASKFWLHGSAWQCPDYENVETFVDWLARDDILMHDPVVNAALHDQLPQIPSRTVRHRFLRVTGLTQNHIRQVERAKFAASLLEKGVPILDTVFEAGYFDQPHLTRALKRFTGKTPGQLVAPTRRSAATIRP